MALRTYEEIIDAVILHLARPDETEVKNLSNTGLAVVENYLYQDRYFWTRISKTNPSGTLNTDNYYEYDIPPNNLRIVRVFDSSRDEVAYTTPTEILSGSQYTIIDNKIVSTIDNITLYSINRLDALGPGNTSNDLSVNHGDILFYGILAYVLQSLNDGSWQVAQSVMDDRIEMVKKQNLKSPPGLQIKSDYS